MTGPLADPEVIPHRTGRAGVRAFGDQRASSTQFWIDISGRSPAPSSPPMAIRFRSVRGSRLPLAIAQRLDVLIDLPGNGAYPIFAHGRGQTTRTGIVLAASGRACVTPRRGGRRKCAAVDPRLNVGLEAVTPCATPRRRDAPGDPRRRHGAVYLVAERANIGET